MFCWPIRVCRRWKIINGQWCVPIVIRLVEWRCYSICENIEWNFNDKKLKAKTAIDYWYSYAIYLDTLKLLWFKYESQTDWFIATDWFGLIWRCCPVTDCFWLYELSITEFCSARSESNRLCVYTKQDCSIVLIWLLYSKRFLKTAVAYLCWWSRCDWCHRRHICVARLWWSLIVCTK